ncbi:MAG: helix-turn-helix domain-containing protein [Pirellulales bacterium]
MNEQLLTIEQVADRLQVHPRTVQAWLRSGELAGIRLGSGRTAAWRIEPSALQAYLDKNRARPE